MNAEDVDVANTQFALEHQDGSDSTETTMMSIYMLSALQYFNGMSKDKVKQTAVEIAMVGINGINPHNHYKLKTIPGKDFSGYQLLAYYYVSLAIAIPEMLDKLQLQFTKAYEIAKSLFTQGKRDDDNKN